MKEKVKCWVLGFFALLLAPLNMQAVDLSIPQSEEEVVDSIHHPIYAKLISKRTPQDIKEGKYSYYLQFPEKGVNELQNALQNYISFHDPDLKLIRSSVREIFVLKTERQVTIGDKFEINFIYLGRETFRDKIDQNNFVVKTEWNLYFTCPLLEDIYREGGDDEEKPMLSLKLPLGHIEREAHWADNAL